MIHAARHYRIEELVPKNVFEAHKHEGDRLWLIFDNRVIWTADALRKRYGKMEVNTWLWDGPHQYRGFRPWDSTTGAVLSQHKFGRALDEVPQEVTVEEIRKDIFEHPDWDEFKFIRAVEIEIPWLHFDVRPWIGQILQIKP